MLEQTEGRYNLDSHGYLHEEPNGANRGGWVLHRVCVKVPGQQDIHYIQHLWADEPTMVDVGGTHTLDEQQWTRWFTKWILPGQPDRRYFLIRLIEDDMPIGEICFFNFDPRTRMANVSMNIEASYRGNGYSQEALLLLSRFYFTDFDGNTLVDDIALENRVAQRALLKFGFEHDPTLGSTLTSMGGDDVFWVRLNKRKLEQIYESGAATSV